jgi:hypothetical protein
MGCSSEPRSFIRRFSRLTPGRRNARTAASSGLWCLRFECRQNRFQHSFPLLHELVVPETQHTVTGLLKAFIAVTVCLAAQMLAAIEFDDELSLKTDEIQHVTEKRMLATELATGELALAKDLPQAVFSVRHAASELTLESLLQHTYVGRAFHCLYVRSRF